MIHCILGHGASGKTTVQNHLKEFIPAITTYTTRPIRHNEIEGIHYHFLNNDQFIQKINEDFFVEVYYIKENDWYYGVSLHEVDYKNKDYCLVIEPNGYKTLLSKIGKEHLKCYYINLNENERTKRMLYRKDNMDEIFRRIYADRKDFENFEIYADLILHSKDSKENSNTILKQIKDNITTNKNVTCKQCGKKELYPKTDMYIESNEKNKQRKIYWHYDCWEFKCNEQKELDELYNTIKDIHGYPSLPPPFFVYLQDLRNGTIKLNKRKIKKYKEGVPYSVIRKAYEMNRKKIHWIKSNKNFKQTISELMYGFRIIESKINDAFKEIKRKEREDSMYVNPNHSYSDYKVEPLKKFPKS